MTDKPKPINQGIIAGIKVTLAFFVAFWLCGYSTWLSGIMGITGGLAFSLIVTWWHTQEETVVKPTTISKYNIAWFHKGHKGQGIKEAQQKRKIKRQERKHQRPQFSLFDFFKNK